MLKWVIECVIILHVLKWYGKLTLKITKLCIYIIFSNILWKDLDKFEINIMNIKHMQF
jgi:hypothetical protein